MTDSEILSKNEKDALLKDVSDGSIESENGVEQNNGVISSYDFSHPAHRLNSRLPVLEVINEKISKDLSSSLSSGFHMPVKITSSPPAFEKYEDFAHALPEGVSITQLRLDPMQGKALFIISSKLIFMLVDSFFGGSGSVPETVSSEFTPTEQRIITRLRTALIETLPDAWSSIIDLKPGMLGEMTSSQLTSPAKPSDVVVTSKLTFELKSGTCECYIVLPFAMLEPFRPQLTNDLQQMKDHDADWLQSFSDRVMKCDIEIHGVIAESRMKLEQLLELNTGDFIPLGQSQSVEFFAENIPLFDATVGVSNGLVSASVSQWHLPITATGKRNL